MIYYLMKSENNNKNTQKNTGVNQPVIDSNINFYLETGIPEVIDLQNYITVPNDDYTNLIVTVPAPEESFDSGVIPTTGDVNNDWSTSGSAYPWKFTGAPGYDSAQNGRTEGTYAWIDYSSSNANVTLQLPTVNSSILDVQVIFEFYSVNVTYTGYNPNTLYVETYDETEQLATSADALLGSITSNPTDATDNTNLSNLPTTSNGSGTGAILSLVISGNTITGVTVTTAGSGYVVGNTLTVAAANIPGSSTDLVFTLIADDIIGWYVVGTFDQFTSTDPTDGWKYQNVTFTNPNHDGSAGNVYIRFRGEPAPSVVSTAFYNDHLIDNLLTNLGTYSPTTIAGVTINGTDLTLDATQLSNGLSFPILVEKNGEALSYINTSIPNNLLIANSATNGQSTSNINTVSEIIFIDSGKNNNYSNGETYSHTIIALDIININGDVTIGSGDTLTIYDGSDNTSPILGQYTDTTTSINLQSINNVFVEFTSDGFGTARGWVLTLTSSYAYANVVMGSGPTGAAGYVVGIDETIIFSDSGDAGSDGVNYSNNENNSQLFTTDIDAIFKINGTYDIETNYDYLYIYDGIDENAPLILTLTGGGSIFSQTSGNELFFKFTSDGSITQAGWDLQITSENPPEPRIIYNFYWNKWKRICNLESCTKYRKQRR